MPTNGIPWPSSLVDLIRRNEPDNSQFVSIWSQNDSDGNVDIWLTIAPHLTPGPAEVNMTCTHDDVLTQGSDTYLVQIGDGPVKDVDDLSGLSKAERATVKPFRINVQPSTARPGDALSIANTPDSVCREIVIGEPMRSVIVTLAHNEKVAAVAAPVAADGTWRTELNVPADAEPGTWSVAAFCSDKILERALTNGYMDPFQQPLTTVVIKR